MIGSVTRQDMLTISDTNAWAKGAARGMGLHAQTDLYAVA